MPCSGLRGTDTRTRFLNLTTKVFAGRKDRCFTSFPDSFNFGGMYEFTGQVKEIFEEQTFGSGFNKREFVVTSEGERYPQDIKFECVKDKVSLLEGLDKGSRVKVFFDLRGREWKGNYYVNLNAWKVEAVEGGDESSSSAPDQDYSQVSSGDEGDEIPF